MVSVSYIFCFLCSSGCVCVCVSMLWTIQIVCCLSSLCVCLNRLFCTLCFHRNVIISCVDRGVIDSAIKQSTFHIGSPTSIIIVQPELTWKRLENFTSRYKHAGIREEQFICSLNNHHLFGGCLCFVVQQYQTILQCSIRRPQLFVSPLTRPLPLTITYICTSLLFFPSFTIRAIWVYCAFFFCYIQFFG